MQNKKALFLTFAILLLQLTAAGQNIIPKPANITKTGEPFVLAGSTVINPGEFDDLANYLNTHIWRACGYLLTVNSTETPVNVISMKTESGIPSEGYTLKVSSERVELSASTDAGMYYAIQTLLQLMPASVYGGDEQGERASMTLPGVEIIDSPRFEFRGSMLDVSRTFFDKKTVMSHIDRLGRHKINKLHWHLTDDNGWRIEIKSYPELTSAGAWRGPGEVLPESYGSGKRRYGGFYTQEDIKEIVAYAQFRNVEIIPEIDLPGHSQVMTHVYPETFCLSTLAKPGLTAATRNVLCAGREENFEMLTKIFTEIAGLFPSKYINTGGDEVSKEHWRNCTRCKELMSKNSMKSSNELLAYFIQRMEKIVSSLGKECIAWNEALKGQLDKSTVILGWEDLRACEAAIQKEQQVIMMPASYLYIDMKQSISETGHNWAGMVDLRRIYSFDPELVAMTPQQKNLVKGVEAALWAEVLGKEWTLEYQAYPRLCALAEIGWTPYASRDYNDFYRRLTTSHLERLGHMGIAFRMFPPEIKYADGQLYANNADPKAVTFYSVNEEVSDSSLRYEGPIATENPWKYNFRTYCYGGISPTASLSNSHSVTLGPREKQIITLPVELFAPHNGIWRINVIPEEKNTTINRLAVSGRDTTYTIIRNGQAANPLSYLRLYVTDSHRSASLQFTVTNNNPVRNTVKITISPSPYIEPKTTVRTSLQINPTFGLSGITDYNMTNYTRSSNACKEGDHITYTFDEPVKCSSIEVATGIPGLPRFIVTNGEVLASADGIAYKSYGMLQADGTLTFKPSGNVKSIRINIKGGNGEPITAFQDLHIKP